MEKDISRFTNIFQLNNIHNVVKIVKSQQSLRLSCDSEDILLQDGGWLVQVEELEKMLQIESSEYINETLSNEELKTAAEMFLYLVACPSKLLKSWSSFYTDLFLTQPPDQIILTLNRMMKTDTSHDKDAKVRAEKLLKRSKSLMSLKYKEIQSLRPEIVHTEDFTIQNGTYSLSLN